MCLKAKEFDPSHGTTLLILGLIYAKKKMFNESIAELENGKFKVTREIFDKQVLDIKVFKLKEEASKQAFEWIESLN